MPFGTIDLERPSDHAAEVTVTGADLDNFHDLLKGFQDNASPLTGKGFVLFSRDSADDTPEVPDAATTTKWKTYPWARIKQLAGPVFTQELYYWQDQISSDPTLLKWVKFLPEVGNAQIGTSELADGSVTSVKIANGTIAEIDLAAGTVTVVKTDFVTASATLGVFDIKINRKRVDPRAFGAIEGEGLTNVQRETTTRAFRKSAKVLHNAGGGTFVLKGGPYEVFNGESVSNLLFYDEADELPPFKMGASDVIEVLGVKYHKPHGFRYSYIGNGSVIGDPAYKFITEAVICLGSNTVVEGNGTTIKLAPTSQVHNRIFVGAGFANIHIENVIFDGNRVSATTQQPLRKLGQFNGVGFPETFGGDDGAVYLGNNSSLRGCKIVNFAGQVINPTNDTSPTVGISLSTGGRQTLIDLKGVPEAFLVTLGSNCIMEGNQIEDCFGGGLIINGSSNIVKDNIFKSLGGMGIALWNFQYADVAELNTALASPGNFVYSIDHYLNKMGFHKGLKLGSRVGFVIGYEDELPVGSGYASFYLKESENLVASTTEHDQSVAAYYPKGNTIVRNHIEGIHHDSIAVQVGIANNIKDNRIVNAVADLLETTGGRTLSVGGNVGISIASTSLDNIVEDNVIEPRLDLVDDPGLLNQFEVFRHYGHASLPSINLNDSGITTRKQQFIFEQFLSGNKVLGNVSVNDLDPTVDPGQNLSKYVQHSGRTLTEIASDNFSSIAASHEATITEFVFNTDEGGFENLPFNCSPFTLPRGPFNFSELLVKGFSVGASFGYRPIFVGSNSGISNIYTGRQVLHLFPFRRDQIWELDYVAKLEKIDDQSFLIMLRGKLVFSYTFGGIQIFENVVEDLDFRSGTIQIEAVDTELIPANTTLRGLVLPDIYQGGVGFYVSPTDPLLYGYNWDGTTLDLNVNEKLAFSMSGSSQILP